MNIIYYYHKILAVLIVGMFSIMAFGGLAGSKPVENIPDQTYFVLPEIDYFEKFTEGSIDPYLQEQMDLTDRDGSLEVLVQFYNDVSDFDLKYLKGIGFTVKRQFHVVPAVYGIATPVMVKSLSEYPGTYWIEYNEPMEYLMDISTTTTNATKVWDTYITDITGRIAEPIDGSGVTVVVVDSGIDAGHPDLDYGEKVILNYKSDTDGAYTSVVNSDTSSGHGTHVSGTIGGNGDASAGARRGMAPGSQIIGISTGEAVAILNALGALEWVYDHSKPNANPYNIRAVSNSWGTSSQYNPEDAIVKVTERLTYENNVVVVFAAGNAGANDHTGETVTTNPYSLTPSAISVAATIKDGSGLAYFSSRGALTDNFTWPDIGAPGYLIWATEARKTLITANVKMSNNNDAMDGYYMAISGTSMATPHVSGLTALLWQAAPSLRVSSMHDEYSGNGDFVDDDYWTSPNTLIHEVELIMKLSSIYMEPDGNEVDTPDDNGVPDNYSIGYLGRKYDYAQGYGFIDAEKAVALAMTLETLRFTNLKATVWDALFSYMNIITEEKTFAETNLLKTEWTGEWSYLNDGRESTVFTSHPKHVYIPNETIKLIIDMSFNPIDIPERQAGTISLTLDYNNDGTSDWESDSSFSSGLNGVRHDEIPITGGMESSKDSTWTFDVVGQIMSWPIEDTLTAANPLLVGEKDFREGLIEYEVSVQLLLTVGENATTPITFEDHHANIGWLEYGNPTSEYTSGEIEMNRYLFDLSYVEMPHEIVIDETPAEKGSLWPYLIVLLLFLIAAWWYMRKKARKPFVPAIGSKERRSNKAPAVRSTDDAGRVEKEVIPGPEAIQEEPVADTEPLEVKEKSS